MMENKLKEEDGMNEEGKKVLIDLVEKIKYEVPPELMAELTGCAKPLNDREFVDWSAKIDALDLSGGQASAWFKGEVVGQLREILHRILGLTRDVGGVIVPIGKRVVKWICLMVERFPRTCTAAVVVAALCVLADCIPVLRHLLFPIVATISVGYVMFIFAKECLPRRGAPVRNAR